jgi:hypothetical protein
VRCTARLDQSQLLPALVSPGSIRVILRSRPGPTRAPSSSDTTALLSIARYRASTAARWVVRFRPRDAARSWGSSRRAGRARGSRRTELRRANRRRANRRRRRARAPSSRATSSPPPPRATLVTTGAAARDRRDLGVGEPRGEDLELVRAAAPAVAARCRSLRSSARTDPCRSASRSSRWHRWPR